MSTSLIIFFILMAFGSILHSSDSRDPPTILGVGYDPSGTILYMYHHMLKPKGVPGGGVKMTVIGDNFYNFNDPKMIVFYEGEEFISHCDVESNVKMYCHSPKITVKDELNLDPENPILLEYNFLNFDDYTAELENRTSERIMEHNLSNFQLYPNPQFIPFDGVKQITPDEDHLTISGRNLDLVFSVYDVKVRIGGFLCFVNKLEREKFTFRIPKLKSRKSGHQNVVVKAGASLEFDIGFVNFE